jgi:hypothetical protein
MEANIKMELQKREREREEREREKGESEGGGGMDRYRWSALVNMVMRLQAPKHAGNFMTS